MRAVRVVAGVVALFLAGCGLAPAEPDDGQARRPQKASDVVTKSLTDVERYWQGQYPKISGGQKFQPITGGFHPYTENSPPPDCGGQSAGYQPNAFYCGDGDYIA